MASVVGQRWTAGAALAFTYEALPGRIVFGAGAARERLAEEVDALGAQRVLLGAAEAEADLAGALSEPLGAVIVARFNGVRPHVPVAVAAGYTTICFKPSQFTDDPTQVGALCRRLVKLSSR